MPEARILRSCCRRACLNDATGDTKGLRRRSGHPSWFQPKEAFCRRDVKAEVRFMYLSLRRFDVNVEVLTHERPMVWRAPRGFFVRLHFQPLIALRALT